METQERPLCGDDDNDDDSDENVANVFDPSSISLVEIVDDVIFSPLMHKRYNL